LGSGCSGACSNGLPGKGSEDNDYFDIPFFSSTFILFYYTFMPIPNFTFNASKSSPSIVSFFSYTLLLLYSIETVGN
jgi:hypothetical protein